MMGPIAVFHWLLDIPFFGQGLAQFLILVGFPIVLGSLGIPYLIERRIQQLDDTDTPSRWDWVATITAPIILPLIAFLLAARLLD